MSFRRYLVPALEDDSTVVLETPEDQKPIVDPEKIENQTVDPDVANPPPVQPEGDQTPGADAPEGDPQADTNTPASTDEPAAAEEAPTDVVETADAPTGDAKTEAEPAQPAEGEPVAPAPAEDAEPAPVVEAPAVPADTNASPAPAEQAPEEANEPVAAASAEPASEEDDLKPMGEDLSLEELEIALQANEEALQDAELFQSISVDPKADDEIENQYVAVLESLEMLAENTANLIETEACTEQTAQIIEEAASQSLQQVGAELQIPAMESYGGDVVIRHKLVLESIDNYADRIRQMLDVNIAQRIRQLTQTFEIFESQVSKFQQNIRLLREQFNKKKGSLQMKVHEGSLTAVGRFFNVNDGNVMAVLPDDVKISEYILSQYPQQIMKNFEDMMKVLGGAKYGTDEEFVAFVKKISAIKPQAEIFKLKDSGKIHALLGNAALIHSVGSLPKTLTYGEHSFPDLADAAKYDAYEEFNSEYIMAILKATNPYIAVGSLVIGSVHAVIDVVTAHKVELKTEEIIKLIDFADKYADNCMAWSKHISKLITTYQKLDVVMRRFSRIGSEISGITIGKRYRVWRILGQIKTVVRNQMRYADTPTAMEAYRSMMGTKYCYYLAKRFVATAV